MGARSCLYVVLHPGASLDLDIVRARLREMDVAAYKLPEHLVFVPELPVTNVGKIDKKALRSDITARLGGEVPV